MWFKKRKQTCFKIVLLDKWPHAARCALDKGHTGMHKYVHPDGRFYMWSAE